MRKYRFYKDEYGWFIDLKRFPFNRAYLAMVQGADTLLENIAQGKNEITLQISTSPIPYSDGVIEKTQSLGIFGGAFYTEDKGYNATERPLVNSLWLCPVTLWVFLRYPKRIHFKIMPDGQS